MGLFDEKNRGRKSRDTVPLSRIPFSKFLNRGFDLDPYPDLNRIRIQDPQEEKEVKNVFLVTFCFTFS
jgi:hypothetical protein